MKILKSLAIMVAVVAIAGGGTYALLSDKKAVTNVTMGAMPFEFDATFSEDDKTVNVISLVNQSLGDVAPGDGDKATLRVTNKSDYNGNFSLKIDVKSNLENSLDPRETAASDAGKPEGELCKSVRLRVLDGTSPLTGWYTLENFGTRQLGIVAYDNHKDYTVEYDVPTTVGNEILTDTCGFDAELVLTQIAGFHGKND